jgi:hypothetical protein
MVGSLMTYTLASLRKLREALVALPMLVLFCQNEIVFAEYTVKKG